MRTPRVARVPTASGALPLLGHAVKLAHTPLPFLRSLSDGGDLVHVGLGPRRAYLVCTSELTDQVLRDARTFDKGGVLYDYARETFGNGLITCPTTCTGSNDA
ncbi:hypothetical protein WDH52_22080 [Streptomyces sp. TRM70308]|uniref:hypothetical protein n=1 Tax=Streptomyces sp. TRM70308 TaxID=3131932 RepID=UPI003D05BB29